MTKLEFTQEDRDLANRVWDAVSPFHDLSVADYGRAVALGFLANGIASNLCNDVRHGHYVAHTSEQPLGT